MVARRKAIAKLQGTTMSEVPPAYYEVLSEAPPAYSEPGEDLAAQLEIMKATVEKMQLEKEAMMWKMHLEKEAMMGKMQLKQEAMMETIRLEKNHYEMKIKRKAEEDAARVEMEKRIQMEKKKEFIAKEKHWSSDFDSYKKTISQPVQSIVSTFLKTIPNETIYAIHSITIKDYGICSGDGSRPNQYSQVRMYIATDSKVYTLDYGGAADGSNYQILPPSAFKAIVTFPSEPTPTFWRAVFSQMGGYNTQGLPMGQGNTVFSHNYGNNEIFRVATAKLEALFTSFR